MRYTHITASIFASVALCCTISSVAVANDTLNEFVPYRASDKEALCEAIFWAEGGHKTKYPYGIKSIDTKGDKNYAKKICINTVTNQIKRWKNANDGKSYLESLHFRYCPPSGNHLNKNWRTNVKHFLRKEMK